MLKNKFSAVLVLCFVLLSSCSVGQESYEPETHPTYDYYEKEHSIKAMWLSCYELSPMFEKGTEESFYTGMTEVFEVCKAHGINTLFVQVRPFCDAIYPSEIFDWSEYARSSNGSVPNFDPLEIILTLAESYSIAVHAWINPYRVSYDPEYIAPEATQGFAVSCGAGVYLDPSSVDAQCFVLDGVREILEHYDVDGIHIDDYFYPQTEDNFDEKSYSEYRENGGKLSKNNWRRENVNSLVAAMYSLVHSLKPDAVFSISPTGNIRKNKSSHYADVELWLSRKGFADWIVPQIYYGFEHEDMPFENVAKEWLKLSEDSSVKLVCGLAAYKQGEADNGAGRGKNEWTENGDVISRQIEYTYSLGYDGYALFSYSSVKNK